MQETMTLSLLVKNQSGVLMRVVGLFARRGFNIDSLNVSETENAAFSRMTIVTSGDENQLLQVTKQVLKLEDVLKVLRLEAAHLVASELLLIKVHCVNKERPQVLHTLARFGARVKDIGHTTLTAELTGEPQLIDRFIAQMTPHGIAELSRSGITALESGDTVLNTL